MNYAPDKTAYLAIALSTVDTSVNFQPVAHVNIESKASSHEPYEGIPAFQSLSTGLI